VDAMEKGVNDAASKTGTLWISFITLVVYFIIAVGSVTHRMLFLQEPIRLPVLNVDLPVVGFFVAAPILLVTYHFYLLLQLAVLSRKAEAYENSLRDEIALRAERDERRQRLDQFPFVQLLVGDSQRQSRSVRAATAAIGIATMVIAPLFALLMIQVVFLAYHDATVTWLHRIAIVVDVVLLRAFWSNASFSTSAGSPDRPAGLENRHIAIFAA